MSSFRQQRRIVLSGLIGLAGCGFAPAYGPRGSAHALNGSIAVAPPSNRDAFNFVRQLELRLGQAEQPRYTLKHSISVQRDGVGLTSAQETTRYNIVGTAAFTLTDTATGKVLTSDRVTAFTGYSVGTVDTSVSPPSTSSTISTRAAERDAHDRLMVALADQVVTRLIATSSDWAK